MSLGPLHALHGEVSVQVLCPLFNWIVFLKWSREFFVYFGDQTLVRDIICKYIFHMVGSLFFLLMFSLAVQKGCFLFSWHPSCLFDLCVCSYITSDYFDYLGYVIQFHVRYVDPSYFVLLSQNCWGYWGLFMVPYIFLKCLFYICVICHWYSNKDCTEL